MDRPSERLIVRFSWTGLILAPLLVPLVLSAALVNAFTNSHPVFAFLMLLIAGCIVSYGTTVFVFLPSLFFFSLWRPLSAFWVCLLGLVLGAAAYVPVTLMLWKGSGPDSGPPTESFLTVLVRWSGDPLTAVFPVAGLMTAGLYWGLGTWRGRRPLPARQ
jgi:hypothetical protein